jgi:hypothetical protein
MTVNDTEIPLQNHNKPTFKVDYIFIPVVIKKTELKIWSIFPQIDRNLCENLASLPYFPVFSA